MLKKGVAIGWEFVAEHGSRGDVLNCGEDVVAKLVVVVAEDGHGDMVSVRINRVGGIARNCGRSGCGARVPGECLLVKTRVRGFDGFTRDGIGFDVEWCWIVPAVCWSRHVSFELSGLARAEDDDFAMFVDDAFCGECVEVRRTN